MSQPTIARTTEPAMGVMLEHECMCHARFALLDDLQEHQGTCETALAIDPADAAEELSMWADFATLKWPHFDRYIWPHP